MELQNYFIKLLVFSIGNNRFILLYGFCAPTTQKPYPWKHRQVPKGHQSTWITILSEENLVRFLEKLTQPEIIPVGDLSLMSPELTRRSIALSNDGKTKTSGPISEYRPILEFWNTHKGETFEKVQKAFGTDGKELYKSIQTLFSWAHQECGIDFFNDGARFGNFEFFQASPDAICFCIETHKECGLLRTTVKKTQPYLRDTIINCISECRGRSTINQAKIFPAEESSIDFFADEPMSRVTVQAWDISSGQLVFSQDITLILGIKIEMSYGSSSRHVRDPWSEKILSAASNRAGIIHREIETLSPSTSDRTLTIHSSTHNEIDKAIEEGEGLFRRYRHQKKQGDFIPNRQKDGEIDSFLKIREYLELSSVKKVTIADPYFSIPAAAKLLTRIPRSDVRLEIVTSLGKINPDTGEINDVTNGYRAFLRDNASLLHEDLRIVNLRRGDRQVFHDRYLIRYFDNGKIDGFLLSNSLNSMGQFYPFVIAPLDQEVCLKVCDYLNAMCDPVTQEGRSEKERIRCEVLFDSADKATPDEKRTQGPELPITWLSRWLDQNGKLSIPSEELSDAVSIVMDHLEEDKACACRMLCALGSTAYPWSARDLAHIVSTIDGAEEEFIKNFIILAKAAEEKQDYMKSGVESPVYKLWALLNDKAQPSRQGFHLLFEQAGHVLYSEDTWLHGGYLLMLWLNPLAFVDFMESVKSPLMFDTLATHMLFHPWSDQLYAATLKTDSLCPQLLCAEWVFHQAKFGGLSNEKIHDLLMGLPLERRVLQATYLLSRIVFHTRTSCDTEESQGQWQFLYEDLMQLAALDLSQCAPETQNVAAYWVFDSADISRCRLLLDLAERVSENGIQQRLLDKVIQISTHGLLDCSYDRDVSELILLYLEALEARFGKDTEGQILGKTVDWNVFDIATEPELKNYAYERWHKAYIRAQRQIAILHAYCQRHPDAKKVGEWITAWDDRLSER